MRDKAMARVVGAAGDLPLSRRHGQRSLYFGRPHVLGATPFNTLSNKIKNNSIVLLFFDIEAIVSITQALMQLIEHAGGYKKEGSYGKFTSVFLQSMFEQNPVCKRFA